VPFVAPDPHARQGEVVANGHCLRHVQEVVGVPHSSTLRAGAKVKGGNVPRGTVIGTFGPDGRYTNRTDGTAHVAILLEETAEGLVVVDQYLGKPVGERLIRWRGGAGRRVNDGDAYHVVEAA